MSSDDLAQWHPTTICEVQPRETRSSETRASGVLKCVAVSGSVPKHLQSVPEIVQSLLHRVNFDPGYATVGSNATEHSPGKDVVYLFMGLETGPSSAQELMMYCDRVQQLNP